MTIQEPETAQTKPAQTRRSPNTDVRRVAVDLMRAGMAGPTEIARLTGLSHQIIHYWQRAAGIDYRAARLAWLQKAWRRLA